MRVVQAITKNGFSPTQAASTFGVARTSIYNWLAAHQRGGARGLKARKRGPRKQSRLAGHQAATIVRLITDRCPDQLKLPFALWTREAVRDLITQRCEVHISVWTVGRYLKRWGFTPQKPLRHAYERNPQAVKQWLEQEYPAIRRQARRKGAEIDWGDEMGARSDHQTGRSYGREGQRRLFRVPASVSAAI